MAPKPRPPEPPTRDAAAIEEAAALQATYGELAPQAIIAAALNQFWSGEIAAVSSFGADSAVLLHMIAAIDRSVPVIFLDTGKHFEETLQYRDQLLADLGLHNLQVIRPLEQELAAKDPDGLLHKADVDSCCGTRKVEPMARAVESRRAWFTGRKRFQAETRVEIAAFEAVGPRIRVNPLAAWTASELREYAQAHGLREHPLVAYGYLSIGCFPCTRAVQPGGDIRSGRWAGQAKTECGIHLPGLVDALGNQPTQGPAA